MRSAQISHFHSNILMGMVRKMRYMMKLSTLASVHNLARYPIDEFPDAIHVSMY